MKPSDVKDILPLGSIWGEFHAEQAAMWTARVLALTGDTWREISWEEIEPLVKGLDENKNWLWKRYLPVLDSEERARSISSLWDLPK